MGGGGCGVVVCVSHRFRGLVLAELEARRIPSPFFSAPAVELEMRSGEFGGIVSISAESMRFCASLTKLMRSVPGSSLGRCLRFSALRISRVIL